MISLYLFKLLFDFIHPQRIREKSILWNLPSDGNCIYRPDYKAEHNLLESSMPDISIEDY